MELEGSAFQPEGHACPRCLKPGPEVSRKTAFQHLDSQGLSRIILWKNIFACTNPSCECLYYSAWQWVPQTDCNKTLGYKEGKPPRIWCYCFGYTDEEVRRSMDHRGVSPLLKQIGDYIDKGGSVCELTHPTGQCCLNFVRNLGTGAGSPGPSGGIP
jgi:hypothetical protein